MYCLPTNLPLSSYIHPNGFNASPTPFLTNLKLARLFPNNLSISHYLHHDCTATCPYFPKTSLSIYNYLRHQCTSALLSLPQAILSIYITLVHESKANFHTSPLSIPQIQHPASHSYARTSGYTPTCTSRLCVSLTLSNSVLTLSFTASWSFCSILSLCVVNLNLLRAPILVSTCRHCRWPVKLHSISDTFTSRSHSNFLTCPPDIP